MIEEIEPATSAQLWRLKTEGITHPKEISKHEASTLIKAHIEAKEGNSKSEVGGNTPAKEESPSLPIVHETMTFEVTIKRVK